MASLLGKHQIAVNTASLADGDSIASYLVDSAGALLTSTAIGGKQRLDVNSPSEFAEDAPHTSGDIGSFALAVRHDANTSMVSADGDYAPLQVDASGALKISGNITTSFTAEHNEDDPATSGDSGIFTLLVRQDTLAVSTSADGDYGAFKSNNLGELYVHDTSVLAQLVTANSTLTNIKSDTASIVTSTATTATNTGTIASTLTALSKAEDAAHASGDQGIQALAVRKDAQGTNVSTDGDYSSLLTWSEGSLKVVDIANGSILQQQVSVTSTAAALPTSALANRKSLMIQNTGGAKCYIGSVTVTVSGATAGIELPANSFMELEVGPAVPVYAIKNGAGGNTVNILEMA